jgi:hypothetical protein
MIKITMFYIISLILYYDTIFAQTHFGFSLEPILNLSNEIITEQKEKKVLNSNMAVRFAVSPNINEELIFSIRPGFTFGGLFTGLNNDLLLFYLISPNKYLIGGFNLHLNSGGGSHSRGRNNILIPFTTCGVGFNISEKSFIEIQLLISLNSQSYGYERDFSSSSPYVKYTNYNFIGMLKVSFGLQW